MTRRLMATHDVGDRIPLPGGYWLEKASDDKWWFGQGEMNIALAIESNVPCGPEGSIDQTVDEIVAAAFTRVPTDEDLAVLVDRLVAAAGGCGSTQDLRLEFSHVLVQESSAATATMLRAEIARLSAARAGDQQRLAHYEAVLLGRGRGDVVATPVPSAEDVRDARRYRRLRVLGCRPEGNPQYGTLLRFQNLDVFVDDDLQRQPSRGEAVSP